MKFMKVFSVAALALGLALAGGDCSKKGQGEEAGEEVSQAEAQVAAEPGAKKAAKDKAAKPGEKVIKAPRKAEGKAAEATKAGEEAAPESARPAPGKPSDHAAEEPAVPSGTPTAPPPEAAPAPVAPVHLAQASDAQVVVVDDQPLDLTAFVDAETVRRLLKAPTLSAQEPLSGALPLREYNAVRFHDPRTTTLGVSVQVWRFSTLIETRRKYDQFASHYPNAQATDAVGTLGFFASNADILHIGFLEQAKKTLVLLGASQDAGNAKNLYLLAKEILRRL